MAYPERCQFTGEDRSDTCLDYPHVHWDKSGWCAEGNKNPALHTYCHMVLTTMGGRKVLNCPCRCHTVIPGLGRLKLQEHIDAGY